ncbi:S24 family peptidase [Bradyrhizobium elkanii]|uniref:S24 family peptidase n=1 Tax=Bradyrhizobium elkanii TaxID=29448 RepID=UPI0021671050|nr:S24 family peptidase [Bradyrhizobium elkanii]MCS3690914.1 phage repressor protein C with HTH and peptisase S24 domain [Bradyrhizobium elkanii]
MDLVRKLILDKLEQMGVTMKEASLHIGRAHSFLYQFLKRGTPAELREKDRIKLAELLGVSQNELRGPSTTLPKRNYEKKPSSSSHGLVDVTSQQAHSRRLNDLVPGAELFGQMDLPILGTAQGGADGALILSELAVDWVARPAVLLRVRDGYGMIVSGDSMSPEHKAGSIALINPHLPPRVGDSCVFRSDRQEDGRNLALIREYRGQTETHWKVHQHNPPKDSQLKKSDWQIVHRTVGNYFP